MDCTNCALTIRKYLEKQGMKEVKVNFATGNVSFQAGAEPKTDQLSKGISDLGERARSKKLSPEDVQGGTFTITNPGVFGGLFGTPIINQPQVAILGVGGVHKRPVVIETEAGDSIAIRSMCILTLTFDHRLIDGAVADQFMAHIKSVIESGQFTM